MYIRTLLLLLLLVAAGCDSNESDPEAVRVQLTMQAIYGTVAPKRAVVELDEAKLLLSRIKFHSDDADSLDFRSGSVVVDLDLANRPVPVFVTDIRAGRYEKITFEIHKPEDNETVSDADFKEGTSGDERFSVVVRGRYDGNPFTFKSREATYQRIDFPNDLVLANPDTTIEVALVVDVNDWFLDDNGLTLNPFDADDRDEIDEAIKRSIRRQQ